MGNIFTKNKNSQIINYNGNFWEFYGIKIPTYIDTIPSMDGINKISIEHGIITETLMSRLDNKEGYTDQEYEDKYSIMGKDGKLYWKE